MKKKKEWQRTGSQKKKPDSKQVIRKTAIEGSGEKRLKTTQRKKKQINNKKRGGGGGVKNIRGVIGGGGRSNLWGGRGDWVVWKRGKAWPMGKKRHKVLMLAERVSFV